jgi:hypothetical protein
MNVRMTGAFSGDWVPSRHDDTGPGDSAQGDRGAATAKAFRTIYEAVKNTN